MINIIKKGILHVCIEAGDFVLISPSTKYIICPLSLQKFFSSNNNLKILF